MDPMGRCIREIINQVAAYAALYEEQCGCVVGDDYVLGPAVAQILSGVHGLLDGPTGELDCGDASGDVYRTAASNNLLDENGELP